MVAQHVFHGAAQLVENAQHRIQAAFRFSIRVKPALSMASAYQLAEMASNRQSAI